MRFAGFNYSESNVVTTNDILKTSKMATDEEIIDE